MEDLILAKPQSPKSALLDFVIFINPTSNHITHAGIYQHTEQQHVDSLSHGLLIKSDTLEHLLVWLVGSELLALLWDVLDGELQSDLLTLCEQSELGVWNRCRRFARVNQTQMDTFIVQNTSLVLENPLV
jgi:hypothetical protein